jgi:hypothetical protein
MTAGVAIPAAVALGVVLTQVVPALAVPARIAAAPVIVAVVTVGKLCAKKPGEFVGYLESI